MVDNNDTSTRATSAYISLNEITVNWNSIGQHIVQAWLFFYPILIKNWLGAIDILTFVPS